MFPIVWIVVAILVIACIALYIQNNNLHKELAKFMNSETITYKFGDKGESMNVSWEDANRKRIPQPPDVFTVINTPPFTKTTTILFTNQGLQYSSANMKKIYI
jgi:hypothetical protein